MAIRWLCIQTVVVWGASLGDLNSIRRRADIEALVQFDRLNRLWCSLAGCSNGRRLVLATALSYLPAYLPACLSTCLPAYLRACLPVSVSDSIWGRGRPDRRL